LKKTLKKRKKPFWGPESDLISRSSRKAYQLQSPNAQRNGNKIN